MRENDPGLEALTRARPEALDPARLAGSRRQHEDLAAILSTERNPVRARPARRYGRVAIPVFGVAVAVAAAVVVGGAVTRQNHAPAQQVAAPTTPTATVG